MNALDPEDDAEPAPSTQAVDASKTPVHDAWKQWSSSPANNAALLQFGIAMLQPRSPGQSGIGAAANALAEGGGAAGRVKTAQDAEDLAASTEEDRKATTAAKTSNAASTAANAAAYGRSVDNAGSLTSGKNGLQNALRTQASLRAWMAKPEDPINVQINNGMSNDPIVQALQRTHPDIKSKADIISNPKYLAEAKGLLSGPSAADPASDDGEDDTTSGASAPAAAAPTVRTIYKNGKAYSWDGVNAPVPQ